MATETTNLKERELPVSTRFMNEVIKLFEGSVGDIALTDFQKRLAQNYFMAANSALETAEIRRRARPEKYRDPLPVVWSNVDMESLARNVVAAARIGLDPMMDNHIHLMPFKNNTTKKYDIVFMEGYRGIELKAKKYGLDVPDNVIVELVYSNDKFKPFKVDINNKCENYEFEITNPFDRGHIIGGFYYHVYHDTPQKNRIMLFTLEEIEKRKPKYASVEFWGGEKDKWENGKKVGKEVTEGWYKEMCWKTIYRAAWNSITIDSQKIDEDYLKLKQVESDYAKSEVSREVAENANAEMIDIDDADFSEVAEPKVTPEPDEKSVKDDGFGEPDDFPEQQTLQNMTNGPGY